MYNNKKVRALGLCSGGLDSILSALLLKNQGIEVVWVTFKTPFFSQDSAKRASEQTGIPLIVEDITDIYMEMLKSPPAGYGKNMNPCLDCHAMMFNQAGIIMQERGYDFIFSGEVVGQRPMSQNKNSMNYVENHSGFKGQILRPLSAKLLPETMMENQGLVKRDNLGEISGRSRKIQIEMAKEFGVKEYPPPAGGCLLTDKNFSRRLRDLLFVQKVYSKRDLYLLKHGRHLRLDDKIKIVVGKSEFDNNTIEKMYKSDTDIMLRHAFLAGPLVLIPNGAMLINDINITNNRTNNLSMNRTENIKKLDWNYDNQVAGFENIRKAGAICAGYTKAPKGELTDILVMSGGREDTIKVITLKPELFQNLMI
ncbi:MAG: tRNA 4-thiouridine(8) synthase ThiI [Desulfamplus sp.]|nr:tRNA 4-thiouridine(8) synthase ThiI [Desulfamplus sp.]